MACLKRNSEVLATRVWMANTPWTRLRGLLGRKDFPASDAMWFVPGSRLVPMNSIHTFFMRFPIDVAFTDSNLVVKKIFAGVKPGRMIWPVVAATNTFEFAAGFLGRHSIREGDQLHVDP